MNQATRELFSYLDRAGWLEDLCGMGSIEIKQKVLSRVHLGCSDEPIQWEYLADELERC